MNKERVKQWIEACREEKKTYEDTEEHDSDFNMSYKENAYHNYCLLLEDLERDL